MNHISDTAFLAIFIISPLIVLILLRLMLQYRVIMAVAFFLLGPLSGCTAFVTVRELSKPHPMLWIIPSATVFFYLFFGLPCFGLWIACLGVLSWWLLQRFRVFEQSHEVLRNISVIGLGAVVGPLLSLGLWAIFLRIHALPVSDKVSEIIRDPASLINLGSQGMLAGITCGAIVSLYINKKSTTSASAEN